MIVSLATALLVIAAAQPSAAAVCIVDSIYMNNRASLPLLQRTDLTHTKCVNFCLNKGFPYAALLGPYYCSCVKDFSTSAKSTECKLLCSGDKSQICGGQGSITVVDARPPEADPCAIGPCKNSGTCKKVNGTTFTCTCSPGWTGSDCSTESDPCAIGPCKNSGTCKKVNGTMFTCTCTQGWTGSDCSTEADPCAIGPCKNSGTCTKVNGTTFTCTCSPRWTGSDCSTAINPCQRSPCKNGGTCESTGSFGNGFHCTCMPGWTGGECLTDNNYCVKNANPCLNGGTCVKAGDTYACNCAPKWAGPRCTVGEVQCLAIDVELRLNCGWGTVTADTCNKESCCYDGVAKTDSRGYNVAMCYFTEDICLNTVAADEKIDCGSDRYPFISPDMCRGWGCCYDDGTEDPTAICTRKASKACVGVTQDFRLAKEDDTIDLNLCLAKGWCYDASVKPYCFAIMA